MDRLLQTKVESPLVKKGSIPAKTESINSLNPRIVSKHETNQEHIIVSFDNNDPMNPYNWSRTWKVYVVVTCIVMVLNSTMGSSLPSTAGAPMAKHFHVDDETQLVLPISIYLMGYVVGPLIFSPLSETYGRKLVMIGTFAVFTASALGSALAPTYAGLIVLRLLMGVGASTPMSVVGGIYADIYDTVPARGLAITLYMGATTWGPVIGPIVGGFVSAGSWRWPYWVAFIVAGLTWPMLLCMPETYGPVVLKHKAQHLRKHSGESRYKAVIEVEKIDLQELVTVVLTRPIRMFFFEAIVFTASLYLAVVYGIFYMFFQAYPIVFQGIYGFNDGELGLSFLPIGLGAMMAIGVHFIWDGYLDRVKAKPHQPQWTKVEEFVRLPLACLGGPLIVISLFWLGWTARKDVHWIVPTLSAIPFGLGYILCFMGEFNYVIDSYDGFAASASAATSCLRSLFGVVLPFVTRPMYERFGIAWACSLLAFLSLIFCAIPFFFIKYGDRIRAHSKFCQELRRRKAEAPESTKQLQASWSREGQLHGSQDV